MIKRDLKFPQGYDMRTQRQVGLFAAQLDNQLKGLKSDIKSLTVRQLEWQPKPGMNTIGMLLTHLAGVEIWWINVAPLGLPTDEEGMRLTQRIAGLETDGIPLPSDGKHPKELKNLTASDYIKIMARARRAIHREMKEWKDRDLNKFYDMPWANRKYTRMWTLYHVLEHFASHYGQILMIKHMMRDAGLLKDSN